MELNQKKRKTPAPPASFPPCAFTREGPQHPASAETPLRDTLCFGRSRSVGRRRGAGLEAGIGNQPRVCWRPDGAGAVGSDGVGAAGAERAGGARFPPRHLGLGPSNEMRLPRSVTYPRARLWNYRPTPTALKNAGDPRTLTGLPLPPYAPAGSRKWWEGP